MKKAATASPAGPKEEARIVGMERDLDVHRPSLRVEALAAPAHWVLFQGGEVWKIMVRPPEGQPGSPEAMVTTVPLTVEYAAVYQWVKQVIADEEAIRELSRQENEESKPAEEVEVPAKPSTAGEEVEVPAKADVKVVKPAAREEKEYSTERFLTLAQEEDEEAYQRDAPPLDDSPKLDEVRELIEKHQVLRVGISVGELGGMERVGRGCMVAADNLIHMRVQVTGRQESSSHRGLYATIIRVTPKRLYLNFEGEKQDPETQSYVLKECAELVDSKGIALWDGLEVFTEIEKPSLDFFRRQSESKNQKGSRPGKRKEAPEGEETPVKTLRLAAKMPPKQDAADDSSSSLDSEVLFVGENKPEAPPEPELGRAITGMVMAAKHFGYAIGTLMDAGVIPVQAVEAMRVAMEIPRSRRVKAEKK